MRLTIHILHKCKEDEDSYNYLKDRSSLPDSTSWDQMYKERFGRTPRTQYACMDCGLEVGTEVSVSRE